MSLDGKTVLVTRAKEQAAELSTLIEENGGRSIELPLIAFEQAEPTPQLKKALQQLHVYRWLLFTSVNGVRFFMNYFNEYALQKETLPAIAVVGEKTEAALLKYGIQVDLTPNDYTAEGMVEALSGKIDKGDRILLVRGNRGRKVINEAAKKAGAILDDVTVYRTVFPKNAKEQFRKLIENETTIDYVTFTSSSTVTHYADILSQLDMASTFQPKIACIGPIAANTARELGICVHIVPNTYTIDALVNELIIDNQGGKTK